MTVIQFKRGLLANLPGLQAGEPGFTTDSYDLYVGIDSTTSANKIIGSHRFWGNNTATTGSSVKVVEGTNNGTNFVALKAPDSIASDVTFTLPGADGSNGQALVTNGSGTLSFASVTTSAGTLTGAGAGVTTFLVTPSSANLASAVTDETGTGSLVFANTPTLVSPILGTPTSGTLTNCTGYTVGNISGLGANVATFLATPSSANLASALTDETGSGALVFANTPTFSGGINASEGADLGRLRVTGIATHGQTTTIGLSNAGVSTLGNATASTLVVSGFSTFSGGLSVTSGGANITGIVTATTFSGGLAVGNITGLGANVATFLATPSSANLASAVTDETGTGALVFANTPTFTGGINASEGADLGRLRVTGITTLGQANVTGLSNAGISTLGNATASTVVVSGFSTLGAASATLLSVSGVSTFSGGVNAPQGINVSTNGLKVAGITTLATTSLGDVTSAATVNVSGFSTLGGGLKVNSGGANITGVVTATSFSGNLAVGNITGLGANVSTFLATPSSANLASAVSDETGSGALVFANSPTLVTPTLGAASATSITVSNDVTVNGNLYVNGSTTQVNTTTTTVEDQLLDLGMVDGAVPSSDLNKDVGILLNYYTASAKKASVFWDDSALRIVAASDVTESTGVLTINAYADLEVGSIYINDCAGQSQLISCAGGVRKLQNITVDGGTF